MTSPQPLSKGEGQERLLSGLPKKSAGKKINLLAKNLSNVNLKIEQSQNQQSIASWLTSPQPLSKGEGQERLLCRLPNR